MHEENSETEVPISSSSFLIISLVTFILLIIAIFFFSRDFIPHFFEGNVFLKMLILFAQYLLIGIVMLFILLFITLGYIRRKTSRSYKLAQEQERAFIIQQLSELQMKNPIIDVRSETIYKPLNKEAKSKELQEVQVVSKLIPFAADIVFTIYYSHVISSRAGGYLLFYLSSSREEVLEKVAQDAIVRSQMGVPNQPIYEQKKDQSLIFNIEPTMLNVDFDPLSQTIRWDEDFQCCEFQMVTHSQSRQEACYGTINISIGRRLLVSMPLVVNVVKNRRRKM